MKIVTSRPGNRLWGWRLLDFFFNEVERGTGYRTRDEAHGEALKAKARYLENLQFYRIKILLKD